MSRRDHFAVVARALADHPPGDRVRGGYCYAALGDSFTAGTGCAPGEGWADRLAARLRARNPRLLYRNLAVDGATSADVLGQLPAALQLEPDLVSVVCGGNDVLRSRRPDIEGYGKRLGSIFSRLRAVLPGTTVVTATSPARWAFLGLGPRTSQRVEAAIAELNDATRRIAASHHVLCLEVADHPGLEDPENFAADGLHPSAVGHARAARAFARLLDAKLGGRPGEEVET
jgi:lysophospholipase L1-like esterase